MNIVVLDGYTLNPGDLSWEGFEKLGSLRVYDRTAEEQIVERAADAEIILTNKTPMSADTISRLPKLRYIGVLATGYNIVDTAEAAKRQITVANVPDYSSGSVAQLVFALLLELCHRVQRHHDAVSAGQWQTSPDFCFTRSPLIELAGKTLGIIGFGRIGQQTARIGEAFGMHLMASSHSKKSFPEFGKLRIGTVREVLEQSDVVSLHCPLTPETARLINEDSLSRMKPTAFLINTARGGLVDDAALARALNEDRLGGAGLDVLTAEPPRDGNPLIQAKNCVITPHIAWATKEARVRLMDIAADNLRGFLSGDARNVIRAG